MSTTIDTGSLGSILGESAASAVSRRKTEDYSADKLDFQSYMSLMVSQLQNQTMYDSADTSEMTQQMAQYSLVSAAESVIKTQNASYAASLVGKQVTASYSKANDEASVTGIVTGVSIYDGQPLVYINGQAFNLDEISMVGSKEGEGESGESEGSGESGGVSDKADETVTEGVLNDE